MDPEASTYGFVVNSIHLPNTANDAQRVALDLDGDSQCRPDNALGQILAIFFDETPGVTTSELVESGRLLHLLEVRAASLDEADGVSVGVYVGIDTDGDPSDNFSGGETFVVDPQLRGQPSVGTIGYGTLRADLGTVSLQVAVEGATDPVIWQLDAVKVELDLRNYEIEGRLTGALSRAETDAKVIPVVQIGMADVIARDCPDGVCVPGTDGETLVDLFDSDGNGRVTVAELRESVLISSLFGPDVDLFDEQGRHNPRCDGTNDSLSFGLSFTAVPAILETAPPMPQP